MSSYKLIRVLPLLLCAILVMNSCSKQDKNEVAVKTGKESENTSAGKSEVENESEISYGEGRRIYRIEKADLNNDKVDELVVFSKKDDAGNDIQGPVRFDMMEVFSPNESGSKYVKISSDTVDFAVEAKFADMSNTGAKEIFVFTNSGGNSTVASEGLFVFGMVSKDSIRLIRYFDGGSPRIVEAAQGRPMLVTVTELFHGVMPMAYAVPYTGSIFALSNNELVMCNEKYPEFFDKSIEKSVENYNAIKRKVEMGMQMADMSYPLYREAAEVIVNFRAKGDLNGLKNFWDQEKVSLKNNIPEDEYTDLSNFVSKLLPQADNV